MLRFSAFDFMIRGSPEYGAQGIGWTEIILRACLEGMGEFDVETSGLEGWLKEDVGYLVDLFFFLFPW